MHKDERFSKIIDIVSRKAAGLRVQETDLRYLFAKKHEMVKMAVDEIVFSVTDPQNYSCKLCNKKGLNKRGLYMHLIESHGKEIMKMVKDSMDFVDLSITLGTDYKTIKTVVERHNGKFYCKFCNKGFTKTGVYRHLFWKHKKDLNFITKNSD